MYLRSLNFDFHAASPGAQPVGVLESVCAPISFAQPLTFITGDNGSGKSTVLETIALHFGLNPEGGSNHVSFATKDSHLDLSKYSSVVREPARPRNAFFLRSETFYTLATHLEQVEAHNKISFHSYSHGQGFLEALNYYLRPKGFYLLDEPDSPLSVKAQIHLLTTIQAALLAGSQLIIATHSPILLSFPGATIYQLGDRGLETTTYEETDAYREMELFISNYADYTKRILANIEHSATKFI